ncbi:hypothetical protein Scep_014125 [Stephania cephalantha]|uniref:Uncharacterized protein n=1 Tax=Stephania cephalantha TaxID=152367 RepID=A0AAP0J0P6_9MAGN
MRGPPRPLLVGGEGSLEEVLPSPLVPLRVRRLGQLSVLAPEQGLGVGFGSTKSLGVVVEGLQQLPKGPAPLGLGHWGGFRYSHSPPWKHA